MPALFIGQEAKIIVGLYDRVAHEFGQRQEEFDVRDESVIFLPLGLVLKLHRWIFVKRRQDYVRNAIAFVLHLPDLHIDRQGHRIVGGNLCGYRKVEKRLKRSNKRLITRGEVS